MATFGMMCERVGMLKITAKFFIEGVYILIAINMAEIVKCVLERLGNSEDYRA